QARQAAGEGSGSLSTVDAGNAGDVQRLLVEMAKLQKLVADGTLPLGGAAGLREATDSSNVRPRHQAPSTQVGQALFQKQLRWLS
ncbi:unnamed protein product, partial [Chrysoparadoxa australica]